MHTHIRAILFSIIATLSLSAEVVPLDANKVKPLDLNSEIPDVTLRDSKGTEIHLSKITRGKPTVAIFYRGSWCPYCTSQLSALVEIEKDILDKGYQIIAISPDSPHKISKAAMEGSYGYSLYSDSKMDAARGFGIAFQVDEKTIRKYENYGINLEAASGESHHWLPVPAVFVFDKEGKITFRHFDPDYKKRLSGDALIKAL